VTDQISIYLPSLAGGGAERVMVTLANALASRGEAVDLVVARAAGVYASEISSEVRVFDLGARGVIASMPNLIRYLREQRPQVLMSAMSHANVVAAWAVVLSGDSTRLVVSEHANLSQTMKHVKGFRMWLLRKAMRRSYARAASVVAVSEGVATDLAQALGRPPNTVTVIYNPIDLDRVRRLCTSAVDHPWFAEAEPPVIIAAGRLTQQKGFSTLLPAFSKLRQAQEARLIILGEGDQRPELEELVRELGLKGDVAVPGFVANPFAYMRAAALFVLSSTWEGFGNVLVESMACGTPVVSTDCPSGPAEILAGGKWGRLVPVGDVDALSNAMMAALRERNHPDVKARAAEFGLDQAVRAYLRLLRPERVARELNVTSPSS
jgi:glycosyltransferase involved in cell wall biosynthesis